MTNKETIKSLQDTLNDYLAEKCFESKDDVSRVCEPFDLAIKALEREETCENELEEYGSLFRCSACGNQIDDTTDLGYSHGFNYCPNCGRKIARENEALATEG